MELIVVREEGEHRRRRIWCHVCGSRLIAPALDVWFTECSQVCSDAARAHRLRMEEWEDAA